MYTMNTAMNTVTRDSDGKVIAPAQSVDDPDYQAYIAWVEAGNQPTIVNDAPSQPAQPKIKVGAFRERLGTTVKTKIEMACLDNPAAPIEQRLMAARLRVMKDDLADYTHVDLARPDVLAGLNELKAAGILIQADIDRIYAPPFHEEELYHG